MGCAPPSNPPSNNATPPAPAIAPGARELDVRALAASMGEGTFAWPGAGPTNAAGACIDPRIPALVPGFDAPFFQAGLAGYSDAAMRIVARKHGCPYCVTEALLDRTLLAGGRGFDKADLGELRDNVPGGADDRPLSCQIMGSEAREMAAAALKAVEQRTRSDKDYRLLAYADPSRPPAQVPRDVQRLRLPGGEQLDPFDPTEGLGGDDDNAANTALEDVSCGDEGDTGPALAEAGGGFASHAADAPRTGAAGLSSFARLASFASIDVNLACPVKKIERKARGGHWLTDPRGAISLLEAVREAVPSHIPCTVKLRRSFDDTPEMVDNFHVIFAAAYDMGYAWATVHARTVEQKYVGPSRWTFLRDLRAAHPTKIIFGSGDVWDAGDVIRMLAWAGMSGVSVARGCIGNPWLFRQVRDLLAGRDPSPPTIAQQREVLREHFRLSLRCTRRFRQPEAATSMMMRKFGIRFAAHHPRSDDVRKRFIAVASTADWERVLEEEYV